MKITVYENGPFMVNTYYVENEESNKSLVIDPGSDIQPLIDKIKSDTVELEAVVCTHSHIDHIAGVSMLTEEFNVPFFLNELEGELLKRASTQAKLFGLPDPKAPSEFENLPKEGDITFAGINFNLLHTPGHSPGSVTLHTENLVFCGDVLFNMSIGRTDLPGGDYGQLIESINQKIFTLTDDTSVLTGHGPATTVGNEKNMNPFF